MDSQTKALLRGIMSVIGAASIAACATREVSDSEAGSSNSEGSDTSGSGSASSSESGTDSADTDSADTDDPPMVLDVNDPDPTSGDDCGEFIADPWALEWEIPEPCATAPMFWNSSPVCFFPPEGTSCEDQPYSETCVIEAYSCGLIQAGEQIGCGPFTTPEGACCYGVHGECAVGRPFEVDGQLRLAPLVPGHTWSERPHAPTLTGLDAATRAALADAWQRYGQTEHASIASFARFSAQLMALGAPASLVAASLQAGADEQRHAQRSFGLAAAYADTPHDPGALETHACHEAREPVAIARSLASEGCVAETVSLILLRDAHAHARDQAVRACLAEIIEDEQRHVLLAWQTLAWMCRRFGAPVRSAVATIFADAANHVGFGGLTALTGDPACMREHGYLEVERRREVAILALAQLVAPSAHALLVNVHEANNTPTHS